MNKQTLTKIISGLIIFVFVISIFQFAMPVQAASNSMANTYSNPNQYNSNNPYKFKVSDVVNSSILTSIVGCTGIVNKVASWMATIIQSPEKIAETVQNEIDLKKEQLKKACAAVKSVAKAAANSIPGVGGIAPAIDTKLGKMPTCQERIDATSDKEITALLNEEKANTSRDFKEQCFDGIAITLAKNQLTAMTRSAMNWVNSGFGGNPFFVQNMQNFTNNIEKNVIETGINVMLSPENANPYGVDFAKAKIMSSKNILQGSSSFLGGLQSDLSAFITDPQSYYTNDQLDQANTTQTVLQRAQEANSRFENDFSVGGWDGYMALTQRDQNNPLGFNMQASQYFTDTQTKQVTSKKEELAQNNGFLSQTTCAQYMTQKAVQAELDIENNILIAAGIAKESYADYVLRKYPDTAPNLPCLQEKVITPGSIIKDKTTNYLNSPERQLELAKTINDSLNAVFSIIISKLEGGGLVGLSDSAIKTDWSDTLNGLSSTSSDGNTTYDNNGAYNGFNLTRDLGNTYIHDDTFNAGTWDANSSINLTDKYDQMTMGYVPPVYRNVPIWNEAKKIWEDNSELVSSNLYWTVTKPGDTKLIDNGFNGWQVGDRAFWDGTSWQNWKKDQVSPIKNRGVIQIQQDYIVAAKEILKILPSVMPKLGELDYCLPGPNPNYQTNSTDAQSAYSDWVGSTTVGSTDGLRTSWRVDGPGSSTYTAFQNIFSDVPYMWKQVLATNPMNLLLNIFDGGYDYKPNKKEKTAENKLSQQADYLINYVNTKMFNNFYEYFDKMMNTLYFKNVTQKYIENELTPIDTSPGSKDENPSYMPMSQAGYDLTKDILFYNDEISKSTKNYTDNIAQAKINIAKLEVIKAEVSKIILAAQDRRDARLVDILKKESTDNGTPLLTPAQYKTKYAECLDEENIQVYDADTISNMNLDTERCFDGIDNDLNGLIDAKDPACKGAIPPGPVVPVYRCVTGSSTTNETQNPQNTVCSARKTESECSSDFYYHGAQANICNWITGPTPEVNPYSLYGCIIDSSIISKPQSDPENQHCFQRTESECTTTKYIDANGMGYSCKFTPL